MTKREKEIIKKYVNEAWNKLKETEKEELAKYGMTRKSSAYVINKILENSKKYEIRLLEWALLDNLATELKIEEIYTEE